MGGGDGDSSWESSFASHLNVDCILFLTARAEYLDCWDVFLGFGLRSLSRNI